MRRPEDTDYAPWYGRYLALTRGADHLQLLEDSADQLLDLLDGLQPDQYDYSYASGKWTIRQMFQHIVDTDQVFTTRALFLMRSDQPTLPGYQHEEWASASLDALPDLPVLREQFSLQRRFMLNFFHNLPTAVLERAGEVNGHRMTVRAIPFIMSGHCFHHTQILRERYLDPQKSL